MKAAVPPSSSTPSTVPTVDRSAPVRKTSTTKSTSAKSAWGPIVTEPSKLKPRLKLEEPQPEPEPELDPESEVRESTPLLPPGLVEDNDDEHDSTPLPVVAPSAASTLTTSAGSADLAEGSIPLPRLSSREMKPVPAPVSRPSYPQFRTTTFPPLHPNSPWGAPRGFNFPPPPPQQAPRPNEFIPVFEHGGHVLFYSSQPPCLPFTVRDTPTLITIELCTFGLTPQVMPGKGRLAIQLVPDEHHTNAMFHLSLLASPLTLLFVSNETFMDNISFSWSHQLSVMFTKK